MLEAYKKVKANKGSAEINQQNLESYAKDLKGNLYKLWNRMRSESYFPKAVREVQIPKKSGGKPGLGIPIDIDIKGFFDNIDQDLLLKGYNVLHQRKVGDNVYRRMVESRIWERWRDKQSD